MVVMVTLGVNLVVLCLCRLRQKTTAEQTGVGQVGHGVAREHDERRNERR